MFGFLKKVFGPKEPSPDPIALVILEETPRLVSRGHVVQALGRAFDRSFPDGEVVSDNPSRHRFTAEGYEMTVLSYPGLYVPKEPPHRDLRLRDAINRHEGSILIDCWSAPEGRQREDATDLMGRIAAELLDDASLAVFCFHTQRLNLVDDRLLPMLREGRAMEAMSSVTFDGVTGFETDDQAMEAAMAEASRRWPEFVAVFQAKPVGAEGFLVKARFPFREETEHMWIEPEAATLNDVSGTLANTSMYNPKLRQGAKVTVAADDISDWGYVKDGEMIGLFTEAMVRGG